MPKPSNASSKKSSPPPLTDEMIEEGVDLSAYMQGGQSVGPGLNLTSQKVNIDFPTWVVAAVDCAADRIGVPRQSLLKMWIVDRLEAIAVGAPAYAQSRAGESKTGQIEPAYAVVEKLPRGIAKELPGRIGTSKRVRAGSAV
jgi:hypothetical protein